MKTALRLVEKGLVPKPLLRRGIRSLLRQRLAEEGVRFGPNEERLEEGLASWVANMARAPIALVPDKANEQHYEVPAAFYELVLGKHLKYSSGFYANERSDLHEAEDAMLALTVERAQLVDGQDVLELGCGWGSLTLYMAERFPNSRILGVSNSASQRERILQLASERGLSNVEILTADMNALDFADLQLEGGTSERRFDRVVSVEMFEHMRNWEALLKKLRTWMQPDGLFFQHVFAHRAYAYAFVAKDDSDWMSRFFFSGGMMPSHDMLDRLDLPFEVVERWNVNGTHYARTSEDWLRNLERERAAVMPILAATYGADQAELWYHRWRVFFLACAELFAYADGTEWIVSHNLLRPV